MVDDGTRNIGDRVSGDPSGNLLVAQHVATMALARATDRQTAAIERSNDLLRLQIEYLRRDHH